MRYVHLISFGLSVCISVVVCATPEYGRWRAVPGVTMCQDCDDRIAGRECSTTADTQMCTYCMTSLYLHRNSYQQMKGCGSVTQCETLWWAGSRFNANCPQHDSDLAGSHFHQDHLTCYYCCRATENSAPYCEKGIIPENHGTSFAAVVTSQIPVHHADTTTRTTTTTTTITSKPTQQTSHTLATVPPTSPTTILNGGVCQVCTEDLKTQKTCRDSDAFHCDSSAPYCMNTISVEADGSMRVDKRCATQAECYSDWWTNTRQNPRCALGSLPHPGSGGIACHYCCDQSIKNSQGFCNGGSVPQTLTLFSTEKKCQVCTDDHNVQKHCSDADVVHCDSSAPYCMNTVSLRADGHMRVDKRCATKAECYFDWWITTRQNPQCALMSSPHPGPDGIACHYCCDQSLFHPQGFCNGGSIPRELAHFSTVSAKTTRAVMTTHDNVEVSKLWYHASATICNVCTEETNVNYPRCDPNNDIKLCTGTTPYCLVNIRSHMGHRKIIKMCGSANTCHKDWWLTSRLDPKCASKQSLWGIGHHNLEDLDCTYCCHSKGSHSAYCNGGLIPDDLTNFVGFSTGIPATTQKQSEKTSTVSSSPTKTASQSSSPTSSPSTTSATTVGTDHHMIHTSTQDIPTTTQNQSEKTTVTSRSPTQTASQSSSQTLLPSTTTAPTTTVGTDHHMIHTSTQDIPATTKQQSEKTTVTSSSPTQTASQSSSPTSSPSTTTAPTTTLSTDHHMIHTSTQAATKSTSQRTTAIHQNSSTFGSTSAVLNTTTTLNTATTIGSHLSNTSSELFSSSSATTSAVDTTSATATKSTGQRTTAIQQNSSTFESTSSVLNTTTTLNTATTIGPHLSNTSSELFSSSSATTSAVDTTSASSSICYSCNDCVGSGTPTTCSTGYCMNTVTDTDLFTRKIVKGCVTEKECYRQWWKGTSDVDFCFTMMASSNMLPTGVNIVCSYCCLGDKCNMPIFPDPSTFYDGSRYGKTPP